jgi:hypothetical protein
MTLSSISISLATCRSQSSSFAELLGNAGDSPQGGLEPKA